MKIIATSDLHGSLPEIEPCDVLIIAGDITPIDFDRDLPRVSNWVYYTLQPWLEKLEAKHILAIPGNHDFCFVVNQQVAQDLPWTWLVDKEITIDGVKFYGTPWVPHLRGWAWYGNDRILDLAYEAIPDDTDVVISHGPPLHFADGGSHYGATQVNKMLDRVQPYLFVCGHVHEGYGVYDWHQSDTIVANVSYCDINYNPGNPPYTLELNKVEEQ